MDPSPSDLHHPPRRFPCRRCGTRIEIPTARLGTLITCPVCTASITPPAPPTTTPTIPLTQATHSQPPPQPPPASPQHSTSPPTRSSSPWLELAVAAASIAALTAAARHLSPDQSPAASVRTLADQSLTPAERIRRSEAIALAEACIRRYAASNSAARALLSSSPDLPAPALPPDSFANGLSLNSYQRLQGSDRYLITLQAAPSGLLLTVAESPDGPRLDSISLARQLPPATTTP
jgi:hypothetical protein